MGRRFLAIPIRSQMCRRCMILGRSRLLRDLLPSEVRSGRLRLVGGAPLRIRSASTEADVGRRGWLVVGGVLSVAWTIAAYNYDQSTHEQMVAEASAQCADLDEKHEEYECRRSWRAAIEKRLPLPNKQLSLVSALAPVPFAWLAMYFGLVLNSWRHRRRYRS